MSRSSRSWCNSETQSSGEGGEEAGGVGFGGVKTVRNRTLEHEDWRACGGLLPQMFEWTAIEKNSILSRSRDI